MIVKKAFPGGGGLLSADKQKTLWDKVVHAWHG